VFLPCHKGKLTVFTGKFEIHKTGRFTFTPTSKKEEDG